MTGNSENSRRGAAIKRAVAMVSEAMDVLDAHGGPAEAAAHLDLALQVLRSDARSDDSLD
jgi:hypothetical protein